MKKQGFIIVLFLLFMAISNSTALFAQTCTITSNDGATVTARGVVYSTTDAAPTIAEGAIPVSIGSGTGSFSRSVGSFSSNTTYYYNAYATNSEGTSYGTVASFTTTPAVSTPIGTGTSGDPYLISNLAELYWIAEQVNSITDGSAVFSGKYFKQTANIDASPTQTWFPDGSGGYYGWTPIGYYIDDSNLADFGGNYDGQNYTISGLYINRTDLEETGLFGGNNGGSVTNLGVINVSITGNTSTGIFGYVLGECTISNCYSTGTITANGSSSGGLIGYCDGNSISQCYSTCSVSGENNTGGLIGEASDSDLSDCHASGSVTTNGASISSLAGGLVSYTSGGTINNSYATGTVLCINGIAGGFIGTSWSAINNCFSTGDVTGNAYAGGFAGTHGSHTVSDCYSSGTVSESTSLTNYAGGFAGTNTGTITKCYTVSSISSTIDPAKKGSFVGFNNTGIVNNDCFWNADIYTTGYALNNGTFSALGKTTFEMKTESTFTNAGWNFTTIWDMDGTTNSGYAFLIDNVPPDVPLPITLASFTATAKNGMVELSWETASEVNNARFIIYRDNEVIGSVEGSGTTTAPHRYTFTDNTVIPDMTYTYILADVDYANKIKLHNDKAITVLIKDMSIDTKFKLGNAYPNPFNPEMTLPLEIEADGMIDIALYDCHGKKVKDIFHGDIKSGTYNMSVNGKDLASGIYMLWAVMDDLQRTQKILLLK